MYAKEGKSFSFSCILVFWYNDFVVDVRHRMSILHKGNVAMHGSNFVKHQLVSVFESDSLVERLC